MILQAIYSVGLGVLVMIGAGLYYNMLFMKPNPTMFLRVVFAADLIVFFWVLGFYIKLMVAEVMRSLM